MCRGGRPEGGSESASLEEPSVDGLSSLDSLVSSELSGSPPLALEDPLERRRSLGRGSGSSSTKESCDSGPSPTDKGGDSARPAARTTPSVGWIQLIGVHRRPEPSGARMRMFTTRTSA